MISGIVAAQMRLSLVNNTAHRYWRIWIKTIQVQSAYASMTELELRATAGGPDQCNGGTPIASGYYNTNTPSKAFDDITTGANYWVSQSAINGPRWIGYQFANPVRVTEIAITAEDGTATSHQGDLKDFDLQYSDDGVTWTTIASYSNQTAWTNNEQRVLTVGLLSGSKNVLAFVGESSRLYLYSADTLAPMAPPSSLPTGTGNGVDFSPDGRLLAVGHNTSPYLSLYNTDDWGKIPAPSSIPPAAVESVAFSPDGSMLAVGHSLTPFVTVYDTTTWTKKPTPSVLPAFAVAAIGFSPDGTKLACGHANSPYLRVYNTNDWSSVALAANPTGQVFDLAWNPSGTMLAVGTNGTTKVEVYNTATWAKMAPPANISGATTIYGVDFSPDGSELAVAYAGSGTAYITRFNVSDWSTLPPPGTPLTSSGRKLTYRPNNSQLAVAGYTGSGGYVYGLPGMTGPTIPSGIGLITYDVKYGVIPAAANNTIQYINSSVATQGTDGSALPRNLGIPSGVQVGDFAVMLIQSFNGLYDPSLPDWTYAVDVNGVERKDRRYKVVTNLSAITLPAHNSRYIVRVMFFRNVPANSTLVVGPAVTTGAVVTGSVTIPEGSVTYTKGSHYLISTFYTNATSNTWAITAPAPYTEGYAASISPVTAAYCGLAVCGASWTGGRKIPAHTWNYSNAANSTAAMLLIKSP